MITSLFCQNDVATFWHNHVCFYSVKWLLGNALNNSKHHGSVCMNLDVYDVLASSHHDIDYCYTSTIFLAIYIWWVNFKKIPYPKYMCVHYIFEIYIDLSQLKTTETIKTVEYLHSFILFISQVMPQRPSMSSAARYGILPLCHLLIADGNSDVRQIEATPPPGMGGSTLTLSMQIIPMGLRWKTCGSYWANLSKDLIFEKMFSSPRR